MDSDTADQLSNKFESALSEILPDLTQLLQQYQVSEVLTIELKILMGCHPTPNGGHVCNWQPVIEPTPEVPGFGEIGEPDPETAQQFWIDIASKMFATMTLLSQSIQQAKEKFKAHIIIDPAAMDNIRLSCKFVDGVLLCTVQPH